MLLKAQYRLHNQRRKRNDMESLRNINFEIELADAVGIIGRNGAGRKTLLKILSRATSPTTGSVKVKDWVTSLLEVVSGLKKFGF